jgi:3-hydroxyisobutyrate dehydrogenase-like beta-hydroxyacid dehydrogenase
VERHRALLEVFGDPGRVVHIGGHGTGYTAKLLVNLLWFGQAVATAEALVLGQRAGIDPQVLNQTFSGSSAASTFIRRDVDALFQGDYLASFGLDRICEELEAVTALARDHRVPFELSDFVYRTYRRAGPRATARWKGNCWPWPCAKIRQARNCVPSTANSGTDSPRQGADAPDDHWHIGRGGKPADRTLADLCH